uniref:Thyroglobulin type-1 domain-containing protein n=1 Tax=Branchiostoma floridae TaxID=7739 RepID=C3ZFN0_BRAFL|eukprot:XP_002592627.1 hypothetical protein BRAFLDRAFT_246248 [Branchiostoma floridae]
MSLELTPCQQENLEAVESELVGVYIPQCLEDGRYQPLQCHPSTGYCWCVDQYGDVVEDTELDRGMMPNCEVRHRMMKCETKCRQARLEAQASAMIGRYVPQCTEDGRYRPLQCHSSTGYCWCVDELGETIEGTKAGPGMVPSCDEFLGNYGCFL